MKKPDLLIVFGEVVPVEYPEGLMIEHEAQGEYCSIRKKINIDPGLEGEDLDMCVVHELFHALADRISLNQAISKELEEILADTVAKVIVENFKLTNK